MNTFICKCYTHNITHGQKRKKIFFAFNSQVIKNMNLSPYNLVFGSKPKKKQLIFNPSSTTDSFGDCYPSQSSPSHSFPNHTHTYTRTHTHTQTHWSSRSPPPNWKFAERNFSTLVRKLWKNTFRSLSWGK